MLTSECHFSTTASESFTFHNFHSTCKLKLFVEMEIYML